MLSTDNIHAHSLPPFANSKNKELSAQIHSKESRLQSLLSVLDDNVSRTDAMGGHLKNVKQELMHTQALHDAKTRQIETEDHFKQLADRECGRLVLEIRRTEKEIAEITDHLTTIQNNIYRGNERIDGIRSELKMEKEELSEWLRVQAEKEEDNFALLKYTKEDDARIKELSLVIEKLMQEVNKKKALLSTEVTETQVAQIELDKTTEAFKRLHVERQELIQQWENAIVTMQKRDKEIMDMQDKYQQTKEELAEKAKVISEKQAFLDMQLANNAETEKRIAIFDRNVCKLRMDHTDALTNLSQFQDEVEVLRSTLTKTSTDLSNRKNEVLNLKQDLKEKQETLERETMNKTTAKDKLSRVTSTTLSLEAKAAELQEILRNEESRNKELDREIKILREQQFKRTQELFRLRQDEKNLTAEIAGSEATLKNLSSTVHRLDQDALKQQALLYAQEFQIQQLERKVRRAQGDRTDEEKEVLLKKIEELNGQLELLSKKYTLLNTQLKKSQEDLRQAKRKTETLQKEKNSITENIDDLNLYTESAGNQLNTKIKEKEELMVEENILRLELRKLRGFLNTRADQVFTLEHRQIQLQLALEERTREIQIHNDMLRVQVKNAEEERHGANSELRDRVGKVEKLRRRYEILMTQFAPEEGEEEHSQAYYVIKASQEREELQREGDELDAKIRKAEKEIKALENTLKLMNDRNEEYRMNLYKAELNASDIQHRDLLEQQYRTVMERYKAKRQDIQTLQQNLTSLERTYQSISGDESSRLQAVNLIETKLTAMEKDIKEQEEKRDRAYKSAVRVAKMLQKSSNAANTTVEELDFRIRECKDLRNLIQTEIARIVDQHPEITMKVMDLYTQKNLEPPSRPLSRVPSRATSIDGQSDTSSDNGKPRTSTGAGRASATAKQPQSRTSSRSSSVMGAATFGGVPPRAPQAPSTRQLTTASVTGAAVGSGATTPAAGHSRVASQVHMSTTNLNAAVMLPPAPPASNQAIPSQHKKTASMPSGSKPGTGAVSIPTAERTSSSERIGPITGAGRIKKPARPGSAGSSSSRGSSNR
ncbi:hypothetical protein CcCBS67573_g04288 [Chytriomyces confervae]|uniref:Coiled-coil domain-containing protein 39 n=1 Tax=Chytriomyces confervae TaxID=246404 RepID=A0A507FFS7_9FUNG|nr:Coiled-coil domain-containing protein 39 [Chytriomyces hyalinus]TPX74440.1 hypothetical protein CcCBS67573_g04288 [Chytriomyces confervae]